jgi:hypothetical protein
VASAILMELNIRLTVLVVETARLERRGVNDSHVLFTFMLSVIILNVVMLNVIMLSVVMLIVVAPCKL